MKRKQITLRIMQAIVLLEIGILIWLGLTAKQTVTFVPSKAPSLQVLNKSIERAEQYYEKMFVSVSKNAAVVAEYNGGTKRTYTVRHATIGGIYYYIYTNQLTKASQLFNFVQSYGFNPEYDEHSFIWTTKNYAPKGVVYSISTYHDCMVDLPNFSNVIAYHSKVCKLGLFGIGVYTLLTRFDTFVPMVQDLQLLEQGQKVDTTRFEHIFNTLGFGMPMCTPFNCAKMASTIRTAQFGVLEMRQGKMQYADKVAAELLKAQNSGGAIYLSYDKNEHFIDQRSFLYSFLDKFLNDKPLYAGFIPTNAESMSDSLAFLLQYRCAKYGVCR